MPFSPKRLVWTEARVAQLLVLTAAGKSASEIAIEMGGGLSKNAVVGKWHRLRNDGYDIITPSKRLEPSKPVALKPPYLSEKASKLLLDVSLSHIHFTERGRTYNKCAPSKFAPRKQAAARQLKAPKPLRVALMDLSSTTCRWPIGDVGAADFCYCGHAPSPGSSYCEFHRRTAKPQPVEPAQGKFS
jgi:GcrA cell cycle regulator